jgi:hypothetical protein
MKYKIKAKVWQYPGMAAWHFLTLPKDIAKEIREKFSAKRAGFGSIRVSIQLGKTAWETSIFRDKRFDSYLLPLKAEVRKKEGAEEGDEISFILQIL